MSASSSGARPSAKIVIPILGMHRSGTSMVTRALNLLGLELGGPLLGASIDNPQGYWENGFFVQTNAELLKALNCDVNGFGAPEQLVRIPDLCRRIVVEDHKSVKVREHIATGFTSSVWGWKDPRTVLTWNVWRQLLADLGYKDVRPVIIVRHPAGAVRSLVRRVQRDPSVDLSDELLTTMATDLWTSYNRLLLEYSKGRDWFIGLYESFVDPATRESELRRLAAYCGLDDGGVALAMESIVGNSSNTNDTFGAAQAVAIYKQFAQLAREQMSPAITAPVSVPTEPDEVRLIRRAMEFKQNGRIDAAVNLLTKGLEIRPHYSAARFLLGHTLMETGHITRSFEQAAILIEANPTDHAGHGLKAFGLIQQARIAEALTSYRESIRCRPEDTATWSNMLFAALYADDLDAAAVTRIQQEGGQAIARLQKHEAHVLPATGRSDRLRIGYLSGDLKTHPVGYFLRQILAHHDRSQVDVTCYDIGVGDDELTTILKQTSQHWCNARSMTDAKLLQTIRSDNIDILIDLCGHSSGNKAGVIIQRAAPVQATYIGYPCTTGLPNMDFIISDHSVSPPQFDHLYTERVQRLDGCFLCFHPHEDAPAVACAPCEKNGFVTFGSFNNLPKISPATVELWSQILHAVDDSRLVMKALSFVDEGTRDLFYKQFAAHGIAQARIDLLPPTVPLAKFLDEYRRIDIALDPIPYGGGTTTCEALWMGVPVLTMPGVHFFSRMSLSILKAIDREQWTADTKAGYIELATRMAADRRSLISERFALRDHVHTSVLCDGLKFTKGLESALFRLQ